MYIERKYIYKCIIHKYIISECLVYWESLYCPSSGHSQFPAFPHFCLSGARAGFHILKWDLGHILGGKGGPGQSKGVSLGQ